MSIDQVGQEIWPWRIILDLQFHARARTTVLFWLSENHQIAEYVGRWWILALLSRCYICWWQVPSLIVDHGGRSFRCEEWCFGLFHARAGSGITVLFYFERNIGLSRRELLVLWFRLYILCCAQIQTLLMVRQKLYAQWRNETWSSLHMRSGITVSLDPWFWRGYHFVGEIHPWWPPVLQIMCYMLLVLQRRRYWWPNRRWATPIGRVMIDCRHVSDSGYEMRTTSTHSPCRDWPEFRNT